MSRSISIGERRWCKRCSLRPIREQQTEWRSPLLLVAEKPPPRPSRDWHGTFCCYGNLEMDLNKPPTLFHCDKYCQKVGFFSKAVGVFTASDTSSENVCMRLKSSCQPDSQGLRLAAWHANGRQGYTAFTYKTLHRVLTGPRLQEGKGLCVCVGMCASVCEY